MKLTHCRDHRVCKEQSRRQIPVCRECGIFKDRHTVFIRLQDFFQESFESRGVDAAQVEELRFQRAQVWFQGLFDGPLDGRENKRSQQQISDVPQYEAGGHKARPERRGHDGIWEEPDDSDSLFAAVMYVRLIELHPLTKVGHGGQEITPVLSHMGDTLSCVGLLGAAQLFVAHMSTFIYT